MTEFNHARLQRVALSVGLLSALTLSAPALWTGLRTEDLVQAAASRSTREMVNLFGGPSTRQQIFELKDMGTLPWITADDFSFGLWRWLSSATHHLDYRLWPDHPVLMHAHSILWYLALIAGAGALFRRLSSAPAAAALATIFYAVDDAHGFATGWLANRNAVVAAAFAFPALVAHDRWRRDGWRPGGILAGALAWVALQVGEIAVGVFGFAAAHVLFLDPAPWRRRWVPLVPWIIAGLCWAVPYRALGFGVRGSGVYIDPFGSPLEFVRALSSRYPALIFGAVTGTPAQTANFDPPLGLAIGLVVLALLGVAASRWVSRDPRGRFWISGMALAALPSCGMAPHDRLLFVAGAGGMALAGELAAEALGLAELAPEAWGSVATTIAGVMLVLSNGVLAIIGFPVAALTAVGPAELAARLAPSAFGGIPPGKALVVVNGLDFYGMSMVAVTGMAVGVFPPPRTRILYAGKDDVVVSRPAPNELVLTAPHSFVAQGFNRVFRGPSRPMHRGDSLQLTGMRYVVLGVDADGMPTVVRFVFSSPLDDGTRVFRWFNGLTFLPFQVPVVGQRTVAGPSAATFGT